MCEDPDDHHELVNAVSQQQQLKINAITVPQHPLAHYRPPSKEKLKRYGFEQVRLDFVEAPDAIKRCLCEFAHLHEIVCPLPSFFLPSFFSLPLIVALLTSAGV